MSLFRMGMALPIRRESRQVKWAGKGDVLLPGLKNDPEAGDYFAAAKRSATAFQFTTFQKAST
jgi:hypothetical protein